MSAPHPTPLEVLRGARELLSDPAKWTKGWFAKADDGREREALDEGAVCWCAAGAIERIAKGRTQAYLDALDAFVVANGIDLPRTTEDDEVRDIVQDVLDSIGGYNDASEHAAIVASFDKAVVAAEARSESI